MSTITLFAQPYDISVAGFYFETIDQYEERAVKTLNASGNPIEEFEIQLIEAEPEDIALAKAMGLNQATMALFFELAKEWEFHQKFRYAIAAEEGTAFDTAEDEIDLLNVEIYGVESLRELAAQFAEDGFYGEIPEALAAYIDHEAMARDLGMEFTEIEIAGERLVYRCG
jgi:antirestriction protein